MIAVAIGLVVLGAGISAAVFLSGGGGDGAEGGQGADGQSGVDGAEQAAESPIVLVAGQPIDAQYVVFHHAIFEAKDQDTPGPDEGLTSINSGGIVNVQAKAIQIVLTNSDVLEWDYELRPIGTSRLEANLSMMESMTLGHIKYGLCSEDLTIWLDQPYEVIDRSGKVIYASSGASSLGEPREVYGAPEKILDMKDEARTVLSSGFIAE